MNSYFNFCKNNQYEPSVFDETLSYEPSHEQNQSNYENRPILIDERNEECYQVLFLNTDSESKCFKRDEQAQNIGYNFSFGNKRSCNKCSNKCSNESMTNAYQYFTMPVSQNYNSCQQKARLPEATIQYMPIQTCSQRSNIFVQQPTFNFSQSSSNSCDQQNMNNTMRFYPQNTSSFYPACMN